MKNNINKAPVKFWEDLLYFQHFFADFHSCPNLVIITTLRENSTFPLYKSYEASHIICGGWGGGGSMAYTVCHASLEL